MKAKIETVVTAGLDKGKRILRKKLKRLAPSTTAASSSSPGIDRRKGLRMKIVIGREKAASGMAAPSRFSSNPIWRSSRYSGRLATLAGNSKPIINVANTNSRPLNEYLAKAKAAMDPRPTARTVATTAMNKLFPTKCQNELDA